MVYLLGGEFFEEAFFLEFPNESVIDEVVRIFCLERRLLVGEKLEHEFDPFGRRGEILIQKFAQRFLRLYQRGVVLGHAHELRDDR